MKKTYQKPTIIAHNVQNNNIMQASAKFGDGTTDSMGAKGNMFDDNIFSEE